MRGAGDLAAAEIIRTLGLKPHPEGGWYAETFRDAAEGLPRPACTAIYYLLQTDEISAWHKVDAAEVWLWHAGAPLVLTVSKDGTRATTQAVRLGPDLRAGERPQAVVPAQAWQTAESLGAWTLVSCVVAPGFTFDGFTPAPPDWRPT